MNHLYRHSRSSQHTSSILRLLTLATRQSRSLSHQFNSTYFVTAVISVCTFLPKSPTWTVRSSCLLHTGYTVDPTTAHYMVRACSTFGCVTSHFGCKAFGSISGLELVELSTFPSAVIDAAREMGERLHEEASDKRCGSYLPRLKTLQLWGRAGRTTLYETLLCMTPAVASR